MEEEKKKKDWWFIGITVFSIFYFIAAWFILAMNLWYSPPSPELGLNEIGDYLAGSFSPLAFFWLAYGYWIQNKELKNQINEFVLNSETNKRSLDYQIKIHNERIRNDERKNKPIFVNAISYKSRDKFGHDINFVHISTKNIGRKIYEVYAHERFKFKFECKNKIEEWESEKTEIIKTDIDLRKLYHKYLESKKYDENITFCEPIDYIISFTSIDGNILHSIIFIHIVFSPENDDKPEISITFETEDDGELITTKGRS